MTTRSYRDIEISDAFIRDFRIYTGDLAEFNRLVDGHEFADEKICLATQIFIHQFNTVPPIIQTYYTEDNFPNAQLLFRGAIVEVLIMQGILETRNFLQFQDNGTSTVINNKGPQYQSWANNLAQSVEMQTMKIKEAINSEEGFGLITSPELFTTNWY